MMAEHVLEHNNPNGAMNDAENDDVVNNMPRPMDGLANGRRRERRRALILKMVMVGALAGFVLFLQLTIWALEVYLEEMHELVVEQGRGSRHRKHKRRRNGVGRDRNGDGAGGGDGVGGGGGGGGRGKQPMKRGVRTIEYTIPSKIDDLHARRLSRQAADTGSSPQTAADAYWHQAVYWVLHDWDPIYHHRHPQDPALVGASATTTTMTTAASSLPFHDQHGSKQKLIQRFLDARQNPGGPGSKSDSGGNDNMTTVVTDTTDAMTTLGIEALVKAAELGHPEAQYVVANALSSGFWPTLQQPVPRSEAVTRSRPSSSPSASASASDSEVTIYELEVVDEILTDNMASGGAATGESSSDDGGDSSSSEKARDVKKRKQQAQAWLYWHMSALAGHVESALAMAHRMEQLQQISPSSISGGSDDRTRNNEEKLSIQQQRARNEAVCWRKLPYYEAAAHGIVDQLEADPGSRAKVLPASDKHMLYQVHLHGGQGSRLEYHNRPDESQEALQFYHVRATSGDKSGVMSDDAGSGKSPQAAFTLATLYHYGLRGVVQNLTLAAEYYEMAAVQGHWEAAGHAGFLHLYGIGVKQDPYEAHRMFRIGVQPGLEGCQRRQSLKMRQTKTEGGETIYTCDDNCLNGMGLLRLFGVPMICSKDLETAREFFELAKQQGNIDAAYNLAMMKMGWKTHFKRIEDLPDTGQTVLEDYANSPLNKLGAKVSPKNQPTPAEFQAALTDLATAASKGHLQARHRLGLMYSSEGRWIGKSQRNCEKALKHFKWIVDNASPQRAARLRKAYKQYIAGDTAGSVRNYLAAAETGSELAGLNAAFLLERGECLGLSRLGCAKASVRWWKAAAARGHSEASLRVGDFYYYGRFRETAQSVVGPFGWVQYLLYPEKFVPGLWQTLREIVYAALIRAETSGGAESSESSVNETCKQDEENGGACLKSDRPTATSDDDALLGVTDEEHSLENDLAMAAQYYRMAAEKSASPRANYNLGFLYEWGLGLKQDFPLAKRHYDLAASSVSREAELPVAIALFTMKVHASWMLFSKSWSDWLESTMEHTAESVKSIAEISGGDRARMARTKKIGEKQAASKRNSKTKLEVVLDHLSSWDSLLLICFLLLGISILLRLSRTVR